MESREFIIALKNMLLQELSDYQHDSLVFSMFQTYPGELIEFAHEFIPLCPPNSFLKKYLEIFQEQKYMGSGGLFAHCLECQHKTKINDFNNWICSDKKCQKQHIIE